MVKLTVKELLLDEMKPFDEFTAQCAGELDEVEQLLTKPLDDDPNVLHAQLTDLEVYSHRLVNIFVQAEAYLTLKLRGNIVPKSEDVSSLEQKVSLNGATVREKKLVSLLERYIGEFGLISKRITSIQSLMADYRQYDRNTVDTRTKKEVVFQVMIWRIGLRRKDK